MSYGSGEAEAVVGDVVAYEGRRGRVVDVTHDAVVVDCERGGWPTRDCRLLIPSEGIRPRPGWEPAWIGSLGRRAVHSVERGLMYLRRDGDRFLVVDGRDDTLPHLVIGRRDGYDTVDEAYAIADHRLQQDQDLLKLREDVLRQHPSVEDVGVVAFTDATGDDAIRVTVVLRDQPDGRYYDYEQLRPIRAAVLAAGAHLEPRLYVTFRLGSEMSADPPSELVAQHGG